MTLEQLAVTALAVGAVWLVYLLVRRPRGRRMRHAVGAGTLPAAELSTPTLLAPEAGAPYPDLPVGRRHAAAQAFPPEPFPLDVAPAVERAPGPDRVVQLPPDPAPAEPVSQHAWMGPDGLVIPMPGRDALNPTGRH